jgi:hypothetical protein
MSPDGALVTGLAVAAVKGLRIQPRDELRLERSGVRENRRFYLVDERGRMVNGKQLGALTTVGVDYDDVGRTLALTFPNDEVVAERVERGPSIETSFFSGRRIATVVPGPFSQALSAHVGQSLRLVEADGQSGAVDRGDRGSVTLISRASLAALARVAGQERVDERRFRMLIEIDGVDEHAEDAWVGRDAQVGSARVRFTGHVGRCLVTSRDPESGQIDLPTLDLLRSYRETAETTEPLAFGIYGRVLEPGLVRVGDPASPD